MNSQICDAIQQHIKWKQLSISLLPKVSKNIYSHLWIIHVRKNKKFQIFERKQYHVWRNDAEIYIEYSQKISWTLTQFYELGCFWI